MVNWPWRLAMVLNQSWVSSSPPIWAIANNAPHPNAAKLFIQFALSEDGFAPWNKFGAYPAAVGLSD